MPPGFSWRGQPTLQWRGHGQLRVGDAEAPPRRDSEGQGSPPQPRIPPTGRAQQGEAGDKGLHQNPQTQSGQSVHCCPGWGRTGKKATPTPINIPTGTSTPGSRKILHLGRRKWGHIIALPPLPRLCQGGHCSLLSRALRHAGVGPGTRR